MINRITRATTLLIETLVATLSVAKLFVTTLSILLSIFAVNARAELVPERYGVLTIDALPVHSILVNTFSASAIVFDADTQQMLGMVSTGIGASAFEIDHKAGVMHTAETYLSRHTRGARTDVISTYDLKTLSPVQEIEILPKHASGSPQRAYTGLLQDGNTNLMLVSNISPAVSISVADLNRGEFLTEIYTAGCGLIYPIPSLKFLQLCGDGTAQLVGLDANGNEINRTRSKSFFSLDDPLSEKGVRTSKGWLFTTFEGRIFEISVENDNIEVQHQFDIADISEGWRMGGMQPIALHANLNLLLVLVHQGGDGTHKDAGSEVWYYNLKDGRRTHRLTLANASDTIQVSQDDESLLYAGSIVGGTIDIYDLRSTRHIGIIEDIGLPAIIQNL
ncbi:MAG: methylamine dehydrogenase heavy chain [Candidatus Azotimanducaceae bacterium]|jgi:methylamine dehydrogenase heavy chain